MNVVAFDLNERRDQRERQRRIQLCWELELASACAGNYAVADAAKAERIELERGAA
jgi:hypothetical protein